MTDLATAAKSAVLDLIEARRTGMYPWRVERATQSLIDALGGTNEGQPEPQLISYAPAIIQSITMRSLRNGGKPANMLTMPAIVRLSLDWLDKREVKP